MAGANGRPRGSDARASAARFGNRPFTMPDECAGKIATKRGETRRKEM